MSKLLKQIKNIPKGYFTWGDVKKITINTEKSLSVAMGRLVKQGEITRVTKGVYTADASAMDWESFACAVYAPSYISFESALATHNILSQKPMHISMVTSGRGKRLSLENKDIIYHHIQQSLFWGYKIEGGSLLADGEKAFLDLMYLSLHGYARFDSEEMNFEVLDKVKLRKYLKKFNIPQMDKAINELGL